MVNATGSDRLGLRWYLMAPVQPPTRSISKPASALVSTHVGRIVRLTLPAGLGLLALLTAGFWLNAGASWKHQLGVTLIIASAWLFAFALLLSFGFLRQLTRPIEVLAARLRRVNPAAPTKSLMAIPAALASNEIGQVMQATNALLRRLEESQKDEREKAIQLAEREGFLSEILDNVAEGIVCISAEGKILRANRAAAQLIGREESALTGTDFTACLAFGDRPRLTTRLARIIKEQDHQANTFEVSAHKADGTEARLNLTLSLLQGETTSGGIIVFRDISETRKAQSQLKESEERLSLALKATRCGVWDYEPKSGLLWWSGEFMTMLGYAAGDIKASLEAKYELIHPEDIDWVKTSTERYLAQEVAEYNPEYRIRRKDGTWMWVEDRGSGEWDAAGMPQRFSGTITDCTERKKFEQQMMYMATHDALTDLPNRTLLNDRLEHALIGNARKGLNVAVLLLDIDRFKLINDSLGHEIGDQLVRAVGQRLQQSIRPTDTLARLSGDEFVVICEDLASPQEAARVAKRLLSSMTQHFIVEGNQLNVGISVGISVSPVDSTNAADILRHADTAMHSAKAGGGNCYRFFVNEMNKEAVHRLTLERHLNEAVERQQFVLHYQPKVDIQTQEVIGAEALIRWPHRTLGNISPMQFIPIAEETGLVLAIGEWVLRETLSQLCLWRDRGYELVPIAVNLSGKHIMAGGVDELILRLLKEYDIPPQLLEVEVTESVMAKMDKVLPPLKHLREAGIGIALDDFGTGYSSLAYLRQLPISSLKIDRSFVKDVPGKPDANSIASIILDIGRQLGLKVVAEGVETKEQLEFLRQRQCDVGQGWLFYKALTPSLFQEKLKKSQLRQAV